MKGVNPTVDLILASRSPRRRKLMGALALTIRQVTPQAEEGLPLDGETPIQFTQRLSLEKAKEIASKSNRTLVLGADTIVAIDDQILGKPTDNADAIRMLQILRGRVHTVVTSATVIDSVSGHWISASKSTEVKMRKYSGLDLARYVASGDSLDKAGSYAVQNEIFRPAEDIHGCYLNVVGLPMCEVVDLLKRKGMDIRLKSNWQPPTQCQSCPLFDMQEVVQT